MSERLRTTARPRWISFARGVLCAGFTLLAPSALPAAASDASLADLARAFVRFEESIEALPPSAADRARVETAFDSATKRFFLADLEGALRAIDALGCERIEDEREREDALALRSLRIEVEPAIVDWRDARSIALRLRSIYAPDLEEARSQEARVVLRSADGALLAEERIALDVDAGVDHELRLTLVEPLRGPAGGWIELRDDAGGVHARVRWSALDADPAVFVRDVAAKAEGAEREHPELARAAASLRARAALLAELVDAERAALVQIDPLQLSLDVARELAQLERGDDPYRGVRGELWRVLEIGGARVPVRLFVPDVRDAPPPALVVALHGAGGNEHLFFEGYGRGLLRQLAEERGFALVCPSSYPFARDPALLGTLLDELARDVAFDPRRVYVIGHSLGGMAAARMARGAEARAAKICCIAGAGDFSGEDELRSVLVILGELDGIVPTAPIARAVESTREAGRPVELRVLAGRAHTLMVPEALRIALDWLGLGAEAPERDPSER